MLISNLFVIDFQALCQDYKNPNLPIDTRVKDLLGWMTLDEKVAQLRSTWSLVPRVNEELIHNPKKMDSLYGAGLGLINPDFENTVEQQVSLRNEIQHYFRTKTRLGIPVIFLDESHHGLLAQQADVFPTSIGLGCSWDTSLVERVYTYVSAQASSRGTSMVLAPVIDVARDPRWGRTGETFGEDPYLCGLMGSAVVRGFQGSSTGDILKDHVAATLKHFTGHGESLGGINQGPADYPERVLRSFHMEPFRLAILRVQPAGLMPAYVEIDGIPCHGNEWLLKQVLRKEWGFKGVVVSDWWAIDQLFQKHMVASDRRDAALQAFRAGVTVDLPMGKNYQELVGLLKEGKISVAAIDEAVAYLLRLKFKLGLFDQSDTISLQKARQEINRPEGRYLALEAAKKSMVLLKNNFHILPLDRNKIKKIAVVGPCAGVNYTGDYSGIPIHNVSILEGIWDEFPGKVVYAKGVSLSQNGDSISYNNYQNSGLIVAPDPAENKSMIDSAVEVAKDADVIVCAVGENEQYSREAEGDDHMGDESKLELPANQDELVKALIATGKPVIVYLMHGRPRGIGYISQYANAIIDGWFTGEESGHAFAKILFGDACPSGKLTISIPYSAGQLPIYYNRKPSEHFYAYVQEKKTPIYAFGYGLSYTSFSYSHLRVEAVHGRSAVVAHVSVDVTNTGAVAGDEIVELYIHQKVASVTRPVKELKDFSRVSIGVGETRKVEFDITIDKLSYWNRAMQFVADPGIFEIMVGGSSTDLQKADFDYKP